MPAQTNFRTCTARRWPIRNARSVAWSSTAGFHQRSTCTTWLAAVSVSPVPPALSDSTNSGGDHASSLEPGDHLVAGRLGHAAVQEQHLAAEPAGQVPAQQRAELGVLGEQQRLLADRQHLVEDLVQPFELARPPGQPAAVAQEVGRVVAHLLELGHRRQHQAAPLDPFRGPDAFQHVVDDRLVERGLLGGQVAEHVHLQLLGQVGDDRSCRS